MFSVAQIRSLQGAIAAYGEVTAANRSGVYQTLGDALRAPGLTLDATRLITARLPEGGEIRGLLFRYREDRPGSSRLTFAENREAPAALHLGLPENEHRPTLIGLHLVNDRRRHASAAHYLLSGALATYENAAFEYSHIKRKTRSIDQLAEYIFALNTPVADLPYPKGRKLAILDIFKKLDVAFVGDLVRRNPEDLETVLGKTHWLTVRTILHDLKMIAGAPIPQWRRPA